MAKDNQSNYFRNFTTAWTIPHQLSDFHSYGLWNSMMAFDQGQNFLGLIQAHDGDFFPESPFDHVELLRSAVLSGKRDFQFSLWPIRVDIDITQRCTDHCYFCYTKKYSFEPAYCDAEIPALTLAAILEGLANGGTKSVRFTGGEPLMHREVKKILPMPKKYGLRSCVITNGCLLDDEISKMLVLNTDHIRISLNAAKSSTRQHLHKPTIRSNDFPTILEQMRYMVRLRRAMWPSQKKPLIWATFVILPENVGEIYAAAQLVKDCGADSISFRPVYHNLSRQLTGQELDVLYHQFRLVRTLHSPPCFQVFTPKRNLTTVCKIRPTTQFARCISCHLRTIIEATNACPVVKICGLHRGTQGEILGRLEDGASFSEVWNSLRTTELLSSRPERCDRCIDISMNVTLNRVWDILLKHPEAIFRKSWKRNFGT